MTLLNRKSLLQVMPYTVMYYTVNLRGHMFFCAHDFELDKGFYFYLRRSMTIDQIFKWPCEVFREQRNWN
jgi:hypothetical protein